jgi:hypothetical protein
MKVVRTLSVGDVIVSERAYAPNDQQARHDHEHASVYLFLAGACTERYGTREGEYGASSIVMNLRAF